MKSIVAPSLPLLAAFIWLVGLIVDPGGLATGQVLLLGMGWVLLAGVATVGLTLVASRWSHRTLVGTGVIGFYVALLRPLDVFSLLGLALTAGALTVLLTPHLGVKVRRLPAADGPPGRAVVAAMVPLSLPLVLGLAPYRSNGWVLLGALLGPAAAFLYAKTIPGGLLALRVGLPLVMLLLAVPMGLPHGLIAMTVVVVGAVFAWGHDAAVAFHPLSQPGTSYAIPPELAPREILEQAGIDETGKRL